MLFNFDVFDYSSSLLVGISMALSSQNFRFVADLAMCSDLVFGNIKCCAILMSWFSVI